MQPEKAYITGRRPKESGKIQREQACIIHILILDALPAGPTQIPLALNVAACPTQTGGHSERFSVQF